VRWSGEEIESVFFCSTLFQTSCSICTPSQVTTSATILPVILTFLNPTQSVQANFWIIPWNGSRPSSSLPAHHSWSSSHTIWRYTIYVVDTASSNILRIYNLLVWRIRTLFLLSYFFTQILTYLTTTLKCTVHVVLEWFWTMTWKLEFVICFM
jgi:hypothetical protein